MSYTRALASELRAAKAEASAQAAREAAGIVALDRPTSALLERRARFLDHVVRIHLATARAHRRYSRMPMRARGII